MKPTVVLSPKRSVVAALLLVVPALSGCSSQAPDGKAGAGGAAPRPAQRAAGPTRNELVVGFLPVT